MYSKSAVADFAADPQSLLLRICHGFWLPYSSHWGKLATNLQHICNRNWHTANLKSTLQVNFCTESVQIFSAACRWNYLKSHLLCCCCKTMQNFRMQICCENPQHICLVCIKMFRTNQIWPNHYSVWGLTDPKTVLAVRSNLMCVGNVNGVYNAFIYIAVWKGVCKRAQHEPIGQRTLATMTALVLYS